MEWNGLPFPSAGDLPDPGIKFMSLKSPAMAGGFFTTSTTWKAPLYTHNGILFKLKKEGKSDLL